MDIGVLTRQALSGSMLSEVGHEFFANRQRTEEQTKEFITALLNAGAYENLAAVMSCGYISEDGSDDYLPGRKSRARPADRYFKNFMDISMAAGVDENLIYPMLFAAFEAPKDSFLYSFAGGIDTYFTKMAYRDYDKAAAVMRRYDGKGRCLSILMEVDEARTLDSVLADLIYGKNVNKTVLRKYLLEKKADIVPALCREYVKGNVKAKEGIVRLLLLYKNEPRAALFLDEIEKNETSKVIKKLLGRDRNAANSLKKIQVKGSGGQAYVTVEEDGAEYTVCLQEDLSVSVTPRPFPAKAAAAAADLKKKAEAACSEMEKAMAENTRRPCREFEKQVLCDNLLSVIASSLLFSVYKGGVLSDIVIVDRGKILNLENNPVQLDEVDVAVSHPVEWGSRFAYLRQLDIWQPFAQIRREVYIPTDSEKSYNFCSRVHGTIMEAADLKASLKSRGFKILNKNKYGESNCAALLKGDIMCVLEFAATDFSQPKRLISMGDVRFYRYADVIKLSGQMYTDGVLPYAVQSLPSIMFSEFLRDIFKLLRL